MVKNDDINRLVDNKLWLAPLAGYTDNAYTIIGRLDEVGLWDTKELTQNEITALYNNGTGMNPLTYSEAPAATPTKINGT
jgi:hypothetical protein